MKIRKLKINSQYIPGHKKGQVVTIHVDCDGTPENPFWRRRLKEAVMDNCCEFIKEDVKNLKRR